MATSPVTEDNFELDVNAVNAGNPSTTGTFQGPQNPDFSFSSDTEVVSPQQEFRIQEPEAFDATTLDDGVSVEDVFDRRDQLESQQSTVVDTTDPASVQAGVFDDPTEFIRDSLFGEEEETELDRQLAESRSGLTETIAGAEESIEEARRRATRETQVGDRMEFLAETNEKIARRQTRFRRELRAMKEASERRGVARDFFKADLNKLEADATAELADLYIIQNAQQGNVEAAKEFINVAVENRYKSIEFELAQRQAELNELIPQKEAEEKKELQQLQFAIAERQANIEVEKEEAKQRREMLTIAAQNGADGATQRAILNASTVDEAYALAGPFIGKLQRQKLGAEMYQKQLSNRLKLIQLAQAGDKNALAQLGGSYSLPEDAPMTDEEMRMNDRQYTELTRDIAKFRTNLLDNNLGRELSAGFVQSPTLSSIATPGKLAGTIGNFVTDGTNPYTEQQRFLSSSRSLINTFGFRELVDLKAEGATFGALTEKEFNAIKESATDLATIAQYDSNGRITGFTDETLALEYIEAAVLELEEAQVRLNQDLVPASEVAEIDSL